MRIAIPFALVLLSAAACGGDDEEPAADAGEIRCSSTTLIVTPRVKARSDGVHLQVLVSQERGVSASVNDQRVRGGVVLRLSPGDHRVRCNHGNGGSMESTFAVVADESAMSP